MQQWTPTWTIKPSSADPSSVSHFGGAPHGLPAERWPVCAACGVVMTPLLRLAPGPWLPRIPEDHVLLVFKCEGEDVCDFWDAESGANACLLVPRAELAAHPLPLPADVVEGHTRLLPQVWVGAWEPSDDGLTAEQAEAVDDPARFWDLPEEIQFPHDFDAARQTKAGGAPYWTGNGPDDDPPRPRRLLFQLDNWLVVAEPHGALVEHVAGDRFAHVDDRALSAANLASDGIAYLFDVTPQAALPTLRLVVKR
ncbi:hypothetical protein [Oerskovia turbata]